MDFDGHESNGLTTWTRKIRAKLCANLEGGINIAGAGGAVGQVHPGGRQQPLGHGRQDPEGGRGLPGRGFGPGQDAG